MLNVTNEGKEDIKGLIISQAKATSSLPLHIFFRRIELRLKKYEHKELMP